MIDHIEREYQANIDRFSAAIIVTQIETLQAYANRFYNRQFITRNKFHHQLPDRMEALLNEYFNERVMLKTSVPPVQLIAYKLNVSPNYLSGVLKTLTQKSTQEHLDDKIIEKVKEKLSTTNLSVSEIAFELGFEYPQTFGNLFKKKTNTSPLEFRRSFS